MGLFSSHYFSLVHQTLVIIHVLGALLSLAVAPVAMIVQKGGRNHRRWGKIYFWGMFVTNISALILLTYRFNIFLLGVTIISFYGAIVGYRVLYRKRPQLGQGANWFDWGVSIITLAAGVMLIVWSVLAYFGTTLAGPPLGNDAPLVLVLLPLGFGLMILQNAATDLYRFIRPIQDRNWWWFAHMNAMLGSYIGLTTALMVQQVGPRLPANIAWIVWILPAILGTIGIGQWMSYYRRQFEQTRNMKGAQGNVSTLTKTLQ